MKTKISFLLLLLAILVSTLSPVAPALAQDDLPVVNAVFFYSPSCGHCHKVLTEDLPLWQEEFGDQLRLLLIDVTTPDGSTLFMDTIQARQIPPERAGGVPALVVADYYLVGSFEIPEQFPVIVREGLASGGIPVPTVPQSLYDTFMEALATEGPAAEETAEPSDTPATSIQNLTVGERFMRDPIANSISVLVLLMLVGSFVAIGLAVVRALTGAEAAAFAWLGKEKAWMAMLIVAFVTLVVLFTIVLKPSSDVLGKSLAFLALAFMIAAVVGLFAASKKKRGERVLQIPSWLLIVVLLAGLCAASYLAYAEITADEAFCGTVGDCNTVQQSEYALLFGFLPMAIFGLLGYVAMILAWIMGLSANQKTASWGKFALLVFALFGTVFSIYLTFLEPFVIGATCVWCLTSALVMMLALWLVAKDGVEALRGLRAAPQS